MSDSRGDQSLRDLQAERNRQTRELASSYESHRTVVGQILESVCGQLETVARSGRETAEPPETGKSKRSLCVLGAGNCNDLNPSLIAKCFHRVDLVDIDPEALSIGKDKLQRGGVERVESHCVDLAGFFHSATTSRSNEPQQPVNAAARRVTDDSKNTPLPQWDLQFDCVLSATVLSQLLEAARRMVGQAIDTDMSNELAFEVRRRHFEVMAQLLTPSGVGILLVDFVSSLTLPGISSMNDDDYLNATANAVREGNFFFGCNPRSIYQQLSAWQPPGALVGVQMSKPWRWQIADRTQAVVMLAFRRGLQGG